MVVKTDRGEFEAQVQRILASKEFSASRQLREFLRFVSQRALDGSTHLDQAEIANAVLSKSTDFNPLDDASVRKLATVTRQRLEHYYANAGRTDPVLVTLPVRSYVPEFRCRNSAAAPAAAPVPATASRPKVISWIAAVAGVAAVSAGATAVWLRKPAAVPGSGTFIFHTVRGDIYSHNLDLPGDAVRLGPVLGQVDDVSVRMRFSPEMESHQAGLLLWNDADHYVKAGRRFTARSLLEFGVENDALYRPAEGTLQYDPDGQSGEPVWLSLRRLGRHVAAFVSRDGVLWRRIGHPVEVPFDLSRMRIGLYAFNGRRAASSVEAAFDHLSVGATFGLGEPAAGRWMVHCPDNVAREYLPPILQMRFLGVQASCSQALLLPVPDGNWTYRTQLDFQPTAGVGAGMLLVGEKGALRFVRHFTSEPTLALIQEAHDLSSLRDFAGSPRLVLRLSAENGMVTASFSRDDRQFHVLPNRIKLNEQGRKLEIGIVHTTSPWGVSQSMPPAEFYYLRREIDQLRNFR